MSTFNVNKLNFLQCPAVRVYWNIKGNMSGSFGTRTHCIDPKTERTWCWCISYAETHKLEVKYAVLLVHIPPPDNGPRPVNNLAIFQLYTGTRGINAFKRALINHLQERERGRCTKIFIRGTPQWNIWNVAFQWFVGLNATRLRHKQLTSA